MADRGNARIKVYTRDGDLVRVWGRAGKAGGEFKNPEGIALALTGTAEEVYVNDTANKRVQVLSVDGVYSRQLQSRYTTGMAVSSRSGHLYTASWDSGVREYGLGGSFVRQWGSHGSGQGQLDAPSGVAVSPVSGSVYVCDHDNNRIQVN